MPKYVSLMNWTDQGIKDAASTIARYEEAKKAAASMGITFETVVWTMGEYDLVGIIDAPDEETGTAFLMMLGASGNLRTKTMRAFTDEEMTSLLGKVS